jgi:Flp pilus assembly protein TadG
MMRFLRSIAGSRGGAALVEFALILPIMVIMFFGTFEVTNLIRTTEKVSDATQTYADLIATMSTTITTSNLTDFCKGAQYVLSPFSTASFSASVASLSSSDGATWTQAWHDTSHCGGSGGSFNGSTAGGSGITPTGVSDSVIVVQGTYTYLPPIVYLFPGSKTLSQTAYARPRVNDTPIPCSNCSAN